MKSRTDPIDDRLVPFGLSNCAKQDQGYRELIENLKLTELSNERIAEVWGLKAHRRNGLQHNRPQRDDWAYKSGLSSLQESEVVEKAIRSKWSLRSIAALFSTDTSTIKFICNKFKRKETMREISITTRRADNRSFISWEHIEAVRCYLGANPGRVLTISDIKSSIERTEGLPPLSTTSIRKILKKHLRYTYKRAWKLHPRTSTPTNIRKIHESIYIQITLEERGYEMIYLDEFSLSARKYAPYNWAPRGERAYFRPSNQDFTMSFMIAFSRARFYGIKGTQRSGDSKMFLRFTKNLIKYRWSWDNDDNAKWWIILDNATIHTSKEIREDLRDLKVKMITICPYCPFLNPAEKLILWVKEKIRSKIKEDR